MLPPRLGGHYLDVEAFPVGDYMGIICTDVTERVLGVENLRKSEARFRQLFEQSGDAIYVRRGPRIVFANPKFEELFGYSSEEIEASEIDLSMLIPPEMQDSLHEHMENLEREGLVEPRITFKGLTKEGKRIDIEFTLSIIEWDGEPAILGIVRDRTEENSLQAQLQQAQKIEAIGRLTGGIAHDFNNLLTAVIGYAELSMMNLESDHPVYEFMENSIHTAERGANLVRQLLAFSRKQIIVPRIIDLNESLASMENMLRQIIGEHISFNIVPSPDLWKVKADPTQLEQIIVNLAVNARDAMPGGGTLYLETENVFMNEEYTRSHHGAVPGEYAQLAITDTGHGMSEEVKEKIFEPFFTTKGEGGGTGLGLSTVYGIVKQNGGFITVYSEKGTGTTFKIYLPRAAGVEVEEIEQVSISVEDLTGDETVLVVEDDETVRKLAVLTLKQYGYTVLEAETGEAALGICQSEEQGINLLFTDVVMPGMSGRDLADRLLSIRPGIKVLFTSGYTENAIVDQSVLLPGVNFLPKPYHPSTLARKVREVLERGGKR